jgi:amidohydrolase
MRQDVLPHVDELIRIRRDLHKHPELSFEEHRTAALVAEKLETWGLEVHTGIAGTGVVGVLRGKGGSNRAIGLRADMDALPMDERTGLPYASVNAGAMHACGHDGHTTMLLGAAKVLAEGRAFDGSVVFIFQPAEEGRAGGRVMVEDGLFDRFPVESVWGMHNKPGLAVGAIAMRPGPAMANADIFRIEVKGRGAHGAQPHEAVDPVLVASHIVVAAQSVVARNIDPLHNAVLSITKIASGSTDNVIPDDAVMLGTARSYRPDVQDRLEENLRRIVEQVSRAFGAEGTLLYERLYPATVNTEEETRIAADVARNLLGARNVDDEAEALMGGEDFSYMLRERPGCYIWLGNGREGEKGGVPVHNTAYDFNDDALGVGVSYWASLVERLLPKSG